ncbi:MAG TPA: o-succinylbenzoate synthase [Longimicrobiales bacterium]
MRLQRIDLREIRLTLREPFRISSGVVTERRILLAQLTDEDGRTVWSECVAGENPNYSAETVDTAWLALRDWFAPRLLDRGPFTHADVDALLSQDVRGHRMARAALEMGVWALEAERRAVPLARLIGGSRDHVDVGISIGIQQTPEALVERARAALADGYRRVKIKVAPGSDIAFVEAARRELGPRAPLMVDANNAYTMDDADLLARLDDFDLLMIEQPLDHEDVVRHAALQRRLRTPLCLDESITCPDRARDMIELGSGRVINIKPGRVGGIGPSIAIHDLCAEHDVPVWCGGMLESGIGRAYNVALASLPNFRHPGDISPSARYWERDVVTPEWTMTDGRIAVPEGAGIGVSVDSGRVEDLTVRLESLRPR